MGQNGDFADIRRYLQGTKFYRSSWHFVLTYKWVFRAKGSFILSCVLILGRKNEILEEILMGLVDSSGRSSMKLPPLRGQITGPDLYKRYAQIMEKAKRENISAQAMTW